LKIGTNLTKIAWLHKEENPYVQQVKLKREEEMAQGFEQMVGWVLGEK